MKPYYHRDGITLYHGDAREVVPSLPKVDMVLTDAPWGIGWWKPTTKDRMFWLGVVDRMKDNSHLVMMASDLLLSGWLEHFKHVGLTYLRTGAYLDQISSWEPVLDFVKGEWVKLPDAGVYRHKNGKSLTAHPAERELEFWRMLMRRHSNTLDLVLDPFAGSGTTLHAAKKENRRAIGIESEKKYCEMIRERLEKEEA